MIAIPKHHQERDQVNNQRDDLPGKMRNRRLLFLFEINIPHITINQRHDERRAQQNGSCADVIAPISLYTVDRERGIKRQRKAKKLIKKTKLYVGATLEKASDAQRNHEGADKSDNRECGSLRVEREGKHRLSATDHTRYDPYRQASWRRVRCYRSYECLPSRRSEQVCH